MDLGALEGQTSGGLFSNSIFDPFLTNVHGFYLSWKCRSAGCATGCALPPLTLRKSNCEDSVRIRQTSIKFIHTGARFNIQVTAVSANHQSKSCSVYKKCEDIFFLECVVSENHIAVIAVDTALAVF